MGILAFGNREGRTHNLRRKPVFFDLVLISKNLLNPPVRH